MANPLNISFSAESPDWTSQTMEERFVSCAKMLYYHGLLPAGEYAKVKDRIRKEKARQEE